MSFPLPLADAGYESPLEAGVNFAAVLADSLGASPELALEPVAWDGPPRDLEERAWRALHEVADPEFPISIVDLGLVYGVEAEDGRVTVVVSFTASACPCTEFIKWDIRERLRREPGVEDVEVRVTWDPPWSVERITPRGREALRRAGVSS
ncbi:MAG: metal-sulfur cluster assembly factor [Gemmatimonadota bacterium]